MNVLNADKNKENMTCRKVVPTNMPPRCSVFTSLTLIMDPMPAHGH